MTDARTGGLAREVLFTTLAAATVSGIVREVLVADIYYRATEIDDDRIDEAGNDSVIEQQLPPIGGTLAATLVPATLTATSWLSIRGALAAGPAPATLAATGWLTIRGALATGPDPATLTATSPGTVIRKDGTLAVTLAPATLYADNDLVYRVTEVDEDRVDETDNERIVEQPVLGNARLDATLEPASLAAIGQHMHLAYVDPFYCRVLERSAADIVDRVTEDDSDRDDETDQDRITERSPETVPAELFPRVTERWLLGDEIDYRTLQHQGLGRLTLQALAEVRVHPGERHFIWASRSKLVCAASQSRPRLIARSDWRKTRSNS